MAADKDQPAECRTRDQGKPCDRCQHTACGWCDQCHPEVPEW